MKNELTFIKMQEIVNNIIEEEKEKYGIELSGGLVNFVQYYKEYLKDDKFNLIKMLNYFTTKGFNDLEGNIFLSLNQINNEKCKIINRIRILGEIKYDRFL